MVEIKLDKFTEEVHASPIPVVVMLYSVVCPACEKANPLLLKLESSYKDKIKIVRLNIDKEQGITKMFSVDCVPTFLIFSGGFQDRVEGFKNAFELEKKIRNIL